MVSRENAAGGGKIAFMTNKKEQPLLNAYLVVGEDALKRKKTLARLRDRLSSLGDLSFNSDTFSGETASGADIVGACNTVPFASEVRLVEVSDADKLKEDDAAAVADYVKDPCPTTILALEAVKLAKNRKLYKAVAATSPVAIIDCAPMKRRDLPRAVRSMAVGAGITMTDGAARLLVELAGEDTMLLDAEVRKLALAHVGKDPVSESDVRSIVRRTSQAKPWEFVDAFAARDIARCMRLLPQLGSTSPYALIGMCTTRVRELMCAQSVGGRGQDAVAKALGVPGWRVKNHLAWARGFTPAELRRALISSCEAERAMKSGVDPEDAFLDWALSVMRKA